MRRFVAAVLLLATIAGHSTAALAPRGVRGRFDGIIGATKAAMLSDPKLAADMALRAERSADAAPPSRDRDVMRATDRLVQRQAEVWAQVLAETEERRLAAERQQQERFTAALETALERTLAVHQERLADLRRQVEAQAGWVLEPMAALAGASLRGARLEGAELRETNLPDADLRGADLGGVDLAAARLTGARLDLAGAVLLAELAGAVVDVAAD